MRRLPTVLFLLALAAPARAARVAEARLWQERFLWDALIHARDRAARSSADPQLLEVVRVLAHQLAQQAANIQQIQAYAKGQKDNLKFAFSQQNPGPSLAIIQNNLQTLARGSEQIRNNLYFLTVRLRMASSQALPDPKLTEQATLAIAQIQAVQLRLNDLYADALAVTTAVRAETWGLEDFFRYSAERLLEAVVSVQDSVFTVYNASYELYLLSK